MDPERKPAAPAAWRPDELLSSDSALPRAPTMLFWATVAFFAAGFTWAALANLDEVTHGDGRVITMRQVQQIQNLEGGIVTKIMVREGETVQEGQVLFVLDDVRFTSALREGQQGSLALRAKVARLNAEVTGTRVDMPREVLQNARGLADQEQLTYQTRQRDLATKNEVVLEQIRQREQELVEMRSRRERMSETLAFIQRELNITGPLVKKGVMSEVELLRLEREASRIRTDLEAAILAMPRIESAISEARKRLEDNTSAFRSQASGELSQARAELAKLTETLPALSDRVDRTEVRSPLKGVVKTVQVKTAGGVVQPGSPMAEVVPLEDQLIVETRLKPSDIGFVSAGQRAVVKVAAYDYSIFGGLEGTVVMVGADSIVPQQGDPYFIAHIKTNAHAIDYRGKSLPVSAGMTATVDILTGHKTVLHYLLKPLNKATENALRER